MMKVELINNVQLAVECNESEQGAELIMRNILGRKLISDEIDFQEKKYSLSSLPKGPYFVQVQNDKHKHNQLYRKTIEIA